MQSNNHIQDLLNKFILNKCSRKEVEEIIVYIQDVKESSQIPSVEDVLDLLNKKPVMSEEDALRVHNNILEIVKKKNKPIKKKNYFWHYAAAASFIGVLATSYFLKSFLNSDIDKSTTPSIVDTNSIVPGTDKATLTLEDGSVIVLEKGGSHQTPNAKSNGEEIVYDTSKKNSSEIEYNYLTIPRGGQFHVILSDGTEVWLNSESQLKYPVAFEAGKTREIELVYGEAYFDVSPSIEHQGSKFKVFNKHQEVKVLGTEFNIKAYKDETNIYTTLVEGKVVVGIDSNRHNLIPNEQSNLDLGNNNITIYDVDVNVETSWKIGIFNFKGKPLKNIMKVISRWYDVDVIFEDEILESIKFNGKIDKKLKLEEILSIMKSNSISDYEIINKTIIIK